MHPTSFLCTTRRMTAAVLMLLALPLLVAAQDLTPRVDTLWVLRGTNETWVDFQSCAVGGDPRVMIVNAVRGPHPQINFLVEYDLLTGEELRRVPSGHSGPVQHMTFARNANIFATAEIGQIKIWRWPELELIRTIETPKNISTNTMSTALLTSDGRQVFDARSGVMYDVATGDTVWTWKRARTFVVPRMTPDDRFLLVYSCGDNFDPCPDVATLLDATTGTPLISFGGGSGSRIEAMAISDDGRYVAVTRLMASLSPEDIGSLVVYDRNLEQVVLRRTLGVDEGGQDVTLLPNGAGILLGKRTLSGITWNTEYHPAWQAEPVSRFAWMGQHFTPDWTICYGSNSGSIGVSRFDLAAVSVANEGNSGGEAGLLYPNPSDGSFTLSGISGSDGPVEYTLASSAGELVASGTTHLQGGQCHIVPQPPLAGGSYRLQLRQSAAVVFSSTVIIQ